VAGHVAKDDVAAGGEVDDEISRSRPRRFEVAYEATLHGVLVDREPIGTARKTLAGCVDDQQFMGDGAFVRQDDADVACRNKVGYRDAKVALRDWDHGKDTMRRPTAACCYQEDGRRHRRPAPCPPHSLSIGLDPLGLETQNDAGASPFSYT
jgi:hypothetical protein